MAKGKKLSDEDLKEWQKNRSVLAAALSECDQVLKDHADACEAAKAADGAVDPETVKGIVRRDGASAGFLAVRLAGGRRGGPQN
jgi:hypothetical protein